MKYIKLNSYKTAYLIEKYYIYYFIQSSIVSCVTQYIGYHTYLKRAILLIQISRHENEKDSSYLIHDHSLLNYNMQFISSNKTLAARNQLS